MSTPEQRKGDSFRRQISASSRYAEKCGLQLVEGVEGYEDIGVSAFKGKNVKSGALGRFLEAVRNGKIARGSYLLVESLDRVSRETPYDASATMRDIVDEGINIVDLSDGDRLYNTAVLREDSQSYMRMVVRFERAHDESKTKSERLKEAWSGKRLLAMQGARKMTTWCPAWLKLSKDRASYEIIEKNADVVRWIYKEAGEGRGIFAIARRLNEGSHTTFGKSKGWHPSYIIKILRNKAVVGIYQPTKVRGRTATEQDLAEHSIAGYYPAIVDEQLFFRVQRGLAERRHSGRGRKGQQFTNLFTGLKTSCAYCGGPVRFENKGAGPKGGLYLVCDNARRQYKCDAQRWPYQHFEDSFLSFVHHELDFSALHGDQTTSQTAALDRSIEAMRGQIEGLVDQREKRINLIDKVGEDVVVPLINKLSTEIKEAKERLSHEIEARQNLVERTAAVMNGPQHLTDLVALLNASNADRYAVRSSLAKLIKGLVAEIAVGATRARIIDTFGPIKWARDNDEVTAAEILLARLFGTTDRRAYYVVRFKNDSFSLDVPPAEPLESPLSSEKTEAVVFFKENGAVEVVESDELEAYGKTDEEKADAPKIVAIAHVATNSRTGTLRRKS